MVDTHDTLEELVYSLNSARKLHKPKGKKISMYYSLHMVPPGCSASCVELRSGQSSGHTNICLQGSVRSKLVLSLPIPCCVRGRLCRQVRSGNSKRLLDLCDHWWSPQEAMTYCGSYDTSRVLFNDYAHEWPQDFWERQLAEWANFSSEGDLRCKVINDHFRMLHSQSVINWCNRFPSASVHYVNTLHIL